MNYIFITRYFMAFIEVEKHVENEEWSMHNFHSHPHYEIYYLSKGSRSFFLSNSLKIISAPNIVVIPPHVMHKTEGGAFERVNINVAPEYLEDFEKEILEKVSLTHLKPDQQQNDDVSRIMDGLFKTDRKSKNGEKIFHSIFSCFLLSLSNGAKSKDAFTKLEKSVVPSFVLNVIDYLSFHYAEKISLDTLSEKFFVSKTTIIYNFKKYVNASPIDFLVNLRITKAKEKLLSTNLSIKEISEACGFSSPNYFGLIFKQKEGLSPAFYRKHQLAKR